MHKIKSITVKGFRGQSKNISIKLKDDANFLIGRNGTGKTTLINLIRAALAIDVGALKESAFSEIIVQFKHIKFSKMVKLAVASSDDELGRSITYSISGFPDIDIQNFEIARQIRRRLKASDGRDFVIPSTPSSKKLRDAVNSIYKTTWLSLQRRTDTNDSSDEWEEDDKGTDVDQKLDQVINDLARYFSRLDRSVADQTVKFQREWFLSFLANDHDFNPKPFIKLDLATERNTLESIFQKFDMAPEHYQSKLDSHFKLAATAKELLQRKEAMDLSPVVAMSDSLRLHTLVEEWQALQDAQKQIYLPKTVFTSTASDMLFRKSVEVNSSNQVVVKTRDGIAIPYRSLSSGEKQLLIFLGETLLQEGQSYIFLADEPELSLHVEWQEELVPNLLKVNPNAQVLFATHSPDIVNLYQDNVTRMEEIID